LVILGSWIKGILEERGILKVGDRIDAEHLKSYGRQHLALWSTDDPDLWYLDFASL